MGRNIGTCLKKCRVLPRHPRKYIRDIETKKCPGKYNVRHPRKYIETLEHGSADVLLRKQWRKKGRRENKSFITVAKCPDIKSLERALISYKYDIFLGAIISCNLIEQTLQIN